MAVTTASAVIHAALMAARCRSALVDRMRGRSSLSYRVRINLARVPERLRPAPVPARKAHAPKTRASS